MIEPLSRYVNWLSDSYAASPRFLAVLRVGFGLHLVLLPTSYTWPGRLPDPFFHPRPGPVSLLGTPPSLELLQGLQLVLLVLAVVLVLGYRTVLVSSLLTGALLLGSGITNSYGKVDHTILVDLLPLVMGLAGWGSAWSLDARLRRTPGRESGFAITCWAFLVGFAMLTAALPKLVQGWLDPSRQATRGYVAQYVERGDAGPLAGLLLGVDSAFFWKVLDYSTVAVEGGLVVAALVPVLFRLVLAALVGFHVGVYLSLGISFHTHAFVYYPFFFALVPLVLHLTRRGGPPRGGPAVVQGPRSTSPAV